MDKCDILLMRSVIRSRKWVCFYSELIHTHTLLVWKMKKKTQRITWCFCCIRLKNLSCESCSRHSKTTTSTAATTNFVRNLKLCVSRRCKRQRERVTQAKPKNVGRWTETRETKVTHLQKHGRERGGNRRVLILSGEKKRDSYAAQWKRSKLRRTKKNKAL